MIEIQAQRGMANQTGGWAISGKRKKAELSTREETLSVGGD
jgi:hypothetical protein